MKAKVLLIEDEHDLGNVVKQYLEVMDFEVAWCKTGLQALETFKASPYQFHIILIDIQLPEMNGFELAERIVSMNTKIPFLFLTARGEKTDRIAGLKLGADDYITKPFDIDELVLRIRNIIRRNQSGAFHEKNDVLEMGNLRYHKDSLKLIIDGQKEVTLTPREAELLEYLFNHPNRVIKRAEILTRLWGQNDYFLGRSLDVFISRIRKYIGNNPDISISNIYGVGFVFKVNEATVKSN
ncbi:response regulator transcription factor [Parasegetibacter sp. NRK P23]|uniref:response regulator transcription factor n=1 Tax=Parasegetibacter sp. NRK P23 TaxID=2942999 RepID=UPI002043D036|nr:response regulator transcription factor [Parasegetibacter sp. NRK P23]MCM5528634.1 response regulator transcription factor [Parasegetibacter sp. NRK P23]